MALAHDPYTGIRHASDNSNHLIGQTRTSRINLWPPPGLNVQVSLDRDDKLYSGPVDLSLHCKSMSSKDTTSCSMTNSPAAVSRAIVAKALALTSAGAVVFK